MKIFPVMALALACLVVTPSPSHAARAAATTGHAAPWLTEAERHLGATGRIVGMASSWCAAYVRFVMRRVGLRDPGSNLAYDMRKYGQRTSARVGAIAVLPHHTGFVKALKRGRVLLVSGNYGRRVALGWYPAGRIIAYRWPA